MIMSQPNKSKLAKIFGVFGFISSLILLGGCSTTSEWRAPKGSMPLTQADGQCRMYAHSGSSSHLTPSYPSAQVIAYNTAANSLIDAVDISERYTDCMHSLGWQEVTK